MNGPFSPEAGDGNLTGGSVEPIPLVVTELYDVIQQDIPFEEKAQQTLEIGSDYLDVENGSLTRIDRETDHWEALISTDSAKMEFPPEHELDLENTYCRRVIHSSSQLALRDASDEGWDDDPAYEAHELHSYIGTPLHVNGEEYGTVFFAAEEPRADPYSDDEKILVELISHMLETELERNQYEAQLTKETNLSLVLNRVLRHNLRNEMSVIRGNTQLMADKLPDADADQEAIRSIDRLISLCEDARDLDNIVASDKDRERTDIRAIIEEVIEDVGSEYPSASISLESDDDVTGAVFPSFGQAIRELIENAAKHSGSQPTVDVTVESVPNGVEIEIVDDGPGIDEAELAVLRSGSETPLMHGSGLGLWLVHWIVVRHDGSLDGSTTEAGTTLTVTVPRVPLANGTEQVSELVRARDQHQAAFDEAGDGMVITDNDACILDANEKAAEIYGMDTQDLLGRSIQRFLPADFDFEDEWDKLQAGHKKRGQVNVLGADGGETIVEYTARSDVVPGQHLIVMRDVTERIGREQELRMKTEAMDKAPVGFTITDPNLDDNPIIYANEKFCEITGYSSDEVVGRNCRFLQGPETNTEVVSQIRDAIDEEAEIEVEIRNYRKDGTKFWSNLRITPVYGESGDVDHFVGFQKDISERKGHHQDPHHGA